MELKKGYKRTEIGVIPEDWDVEKLGHCLLYKPMYGIGAPAVPYSENFPVYIRITDISDDGKFIQENKVSVNSPESNKYFLDKDDILFARTGASTGKTYLYSEKDGMLVFAGFLIKVKVDPNQLNARFLKSFTETHTYWNWVRLMSMRSGQPGINSNEYAQLLIPLPPLREQKAIAAVLSDTDALITSLEKLIDKKRSIKQGTMQELLTGKRRLPGFSGEWETKKLGEIGQFKNGINKNEEDFGHGFPFVNLLNVFGKPIIKQNISFGLVNSSEEERKIYELKKGDVVFIRSSVKPEGVGLTSVVYEDLKSTVYSGFIIRYRDNGELDLNYKIHCFNERGFRKRLINNSTVSANTNINQETLKNMYIYLPPTKKEQTAIASVLSDMDAEIEALLKKLNKYRAIKQGMMQVLLTGKVRLVDK